MCDANDQSCLHPWLKLASMTETSQFHTPRGSWEILSGYLPAVTTLQWLPYSSHYTALHACILCLLTTCGIYICCKDKQFVFFFLRLSCLLCSSNCICSLSSIFTKHAVTLPDKMHLSANSARSLQTLHLLIWLPLPWQPHLTDSNGAPCALPDLPWLMTAHDSVP